MFHLIIGQRTSYWSDEYITNAYVGIQVSYKWAQKEWTFFLHPIIDDHSKSIKYFAFDTNSQKDTFLNMLKIQGIWPKVAFEIAHLDHNRLSNAVQWFDISFFQSIPGIWPKTAKKILVELKSSFSDNDLIKINADDKLIKNITKTLTTMWYDKNKVLTKLSSYEQSIATETLPEVLQWMIKELK